MITMIKRIIKNYFKGQQERELKKLEVLKDIKRLENMEVIITDDDIFVIESYEIIEKEDLQLIKK